MIILFITRAYGTNSGGMERLSFELISEVKKQPGVIVKTITHAGSRATALFFVLFTIPRALMASRQVDVVHLGDPTLALIGWLIKKIYKKPITVTVHGLDILYDLTIYQLYLKLFFRNFDLYLAISGYVSGLLKTKFSKTKSEVLVLNPGIYDTYYQPSTSRDKLTKLLMHVAGYQLLSRDLVLLTAGRLIKRKGHAWFIQKILPAMSSNVVYVIAGDGPQKEALQQQILSSGRRVIMLGRVSENDLSILYNTVDAFIQPNNFTENDAEGFGLVLLQAAVCCRQIFASRVDGIVDAIHDGQNGTLLNPQDAPAWISVLKEFLQNPKPNLQARRFTLERFNWPKQAEAFISSLQQLLPNES